MFWYCYEVALAASYLKDFSAWGNCDRLACYLSRTLQNAPPKSKYKSNNEPLCVCDKDRLCVFLRIMTVSVTDQLIAYLSRICSRLSRNLRSQPKSLPSLLNCVLQGPTGKCCLQFQPEIFVCLSTPNCPENHYWRLPSIVISNFMLFKEFTLKFQCVRFGSI